MVLLLLVAASGAQAKPGWPQKKITYVVKDRSVKKEARFGARAWNRANVRYKFVPFRGKGRADLIVRDSRKCDGMARPAGPSQSWANIADASRCTVWKTIVSHEFGHILGLSHTRKPCSLMNAASSSCSARVPDQRAKRKVRKWARQRDAAMRSAPKKLKFKITAEPYTITGEFAGYYEWPYGVNFTIEITSTSMTIADVTFDRVRYHEDADVLYLHAGNPADAVNFDESPEGHHLRFASDGQLIGITIARPRWLLENEGKMTITLPEQVSIDHEELREALSAA